MGSHNGLALRVTQNNSNTIPLSHNIHERVLVVVVKLQILCNREHSKYEALQEHTKCYIENTSNNVITRTHQIWGQILKSNFRKITKKQENVYFLGKLRSSAKITSYETWSNDE